jgi:glycosyltransferase involved in cell wall biosynthesis
MNILLVNGTHPDAPHISGVRAARFAGELAKLGHRCVLICPPLAGRPVAPPSSLEAHDWSRPYIAEVSETQAVARGRLSTGLSVIRHGGLRHTFRRNVVARGREIAKTFHPDAGWATFGVLEGVVALRQLAREIGFPWLFDVKDNSDLYLPRRARAPLAWRLRGFAALQANSQLHADEARNWLGQNAEIVYSGVDACFFAPADAAPGRYITLVGSLYRRELVDALVGAVAAHNREHDPLRIVHLGTQGDWVAAAGAAHGVATEAPGYVSAERMAELCRHALANSYVFLGRTFHHKLFELIACRRPVIAYGGELPESFAVAGRLHAPLFAPAAPEALGAALAQIDTPGYAIDSRLPERFFTWPEQAAMVDSAIRRMQRAPANA